MVATGHAYEWHRFRDLRSLHASEHHEGLRCPELIGFGALDHEPKSFGCWRPRREEGDVSPAGFRGDVVGRRQLVCELRHSEHGVECEECGGAKIID